MNAQPKQVIVVGGGPLALILALMLHRMGVTVTLVGEPSPTNPPLNPELMLIGGDDVLPPVYQRSLSEWKTLGERLNLPLVIRDVVAEDLATSIGRVAKLKEEALMDALGGENMNFVEGPSTYSDMALGYKVWSDAPMLGNDTLAQLQQAVAQAAIARLPTNPFSLSVANLDRPQLTLEGGSVLQANQIVFTSARALRRVLSPLGLSLPLRPARGHVMMLETDRPHGLPLILQRLQRGHLFMVPVGASRVDVHYDAINDPAQATFNIQHSSSLVTALQQHVGMLVPRLANASLLAVATSRQWLTPDYLPAIGPWPGLSGVLVGTGWGGRATALAAGAAGMLADSLMNAAVIDIQGLAPNRFANGLWQVVKQPGSLTWQEPVEDRSTSLMAVKPDYAEHVTMTEHPKPQYATNVQQVGKTITENAGRRQATLQAREKKKIVTASIKNE